MSELQRWVSEAPAGTVWRLTAQGEHRVLPDGVMDLIWWGDRFLFAGPDLAAYTVAYEKPTELWGFRFAPGAAATLLKMPANELLGTSLFDADIPGLPSSAFDAMHRNPEATLHAITQRLWNRVDADRRDLALVASIDRDAHAGLDVRTIADRHNLSERSLRRLSHRAFGYGPKTLASIHRFQRALHLARSGTPLADAAQAAGYADQSHLSRETKRLAGVPLTSLISPAS
ncbi:MAG: helix-turn-helix domain-containing protein [Promicromonosporaceae bacterium]|nr:helix-turn-helix domain-containing protein [Promicromonosporaceae bacterium]